MNDLPEYVIGPKGEMVNVREFVETYARLVREMIERERQQAMIEAMTPWKSKNQK
jgi:hypothetical protein